MRITAGVMARACLLACVPLTSLAQTEPVIVEAEGPNATLGSAMAVATTPAGVTYVTTTLNGTTAPSAADAVSMTRVNSLQITFPAAGNYDLYARYLVGPNAPNDDSWYFGFGFNNSTNWALQNDSNTGFTQPGQTVFNGGNVPSQVFKWVRITGSQGPGTWTVPAGNLTQTFYWATREDGMQMDKFAFGRQGSWYTVSNLDTGSAATGTPPPLPPPEPPAYTRVGPPLATGYEPKFLGGAHSGGNSLNFGAYWNQVTPENGGKWGSAQPQSPFGPAADGYPRLPNPAFNWFEARNAREQARNNGQIFKWHVLFWGNQQPQWIESLPVDKQLEAIHIWLGAIAAEFPDLEHIEVVNEPLHDPPCGPSNGNYCEALGGRGGPADVGTDREFLYIVNAFRLARQYFPNAKLMLNDYSITNDGNATTNYLRIINLLKSENLIDLVGVQGHAFEFNYNNMAGSVFTHTTNIARLAQAGLPIYVTEFDIDGNFPTFNVIDDAAHTLRYQTLFPLFWENDLIRGVTMWGHVRGGHWRTNQGAWLMYPNGAERPALQWLVRYMENELAVITAGQSFTVSEALAGGAAVGTVVATDADSGTVLSLWQINSDPSGKFDIDPATGALSLRADATLDFETATSHTVGVSVWDGYRRSSGSVTVNVTNENDNAPVVAAGQSFSIDDDTTYSYILGLIEATDADDTNAPGFTTLRGWKRHGGTGANIFDISSHLGNVNIARPLLIDFSKTEYTLIVSVSDGANRSATETLTVTIPDMVKLCFKGKQLVVAKQAAMALIRKGACLGTCPAN